MKRRAGTLKERRPKLDSVPRDCPTELVAIMESGWADEAADRPSFAGMVPMLEPITTGGERQAAVATSVAAPWAGLDTQDLPRWEIGQLADVVFSFCTHTERGTGKDGNGALWINALVRMFRDRGIKAFATTMLPPGTTSVSAAFERQVQQCRILIVVLSHREGGVGAAARPPVSQRAVPQATSKAPFALVSCSTR